MTGLVDPAPAADPLAEALVVALVCVPLAAALLLLAYLASLRATARGSDREVERFATGFGVLTSATTLVLAAVATVRTALSPTDGVVLRAPIDVPWIPALGVHLRLGLDGVSAPLVLLTALLGLAVCWHLVRVRPAAGHTGGLVACVLAVTGGAIATFVALDLVVFFIAFETVLVPMWFVIARWGDVTQPAATVPPSASRLGGEGARRDAANRFVLFTVTGSALMLLGILLVGLRTGTTDLVELAARRGAGLSTAEQTAAAILIMLGLAVKAPMFPLHTWLPPAHTIAPTAGSVLLAGVLLKMGTYGLVRIAVPVVPDGVRAVAPLLGAFAVAGVLWAGLACFVERDLKRLVALSSVAHMGFVLLGVATMTPAGLQGALFANIAHGLITGLLFFVVGAVKDRHHTAVLAELAPGLRDRLPRLGWLLAFGCIAGLGLPGLAGFWGELLAIVGAWQSDSAIGALSRPLAVFAAVGTLVAAVYLLRVLRELWHGAAPDLGPLDAAADRTGTGTDAGVGDEAAEGTRDRPRVLVVTVGDATRHEVTVMMPLVVATAVLGLLPWLLLDLTGPTVDWLLGVGR